METLIMSLMIWISQATGWAIPEAPNVKYATKAEMVSLAYECDIKIDVDNKYVCELSDEEKATGDDLIKPLALYDTVREVVILPKYFDASSIKDQSILLHELVHYMQWKNKIWPNEYICREHTERDAYKLQEQFLAEAGMDIHEEIQIGPLLRFMLTECQGGMSWGR